MDFKFFIGESVSMIGMLYKETTPAVGSTPAVLEPETGKTLKALFRRGTGSFAEVIGEETLTEDTTVPGMYILFIDTAKYNGDLNIRIYIAEQQGIVVADRRINLIGQPK